MNAILKRFTFLSLALLLAFLTGCGTAQPPATATPKAVEAAVSPSATRVITDMAGRKVTLPSVISKIYSTGQPGVVMLYTLCPDKLLGWCSAPTKNETPYIGSKYLSLPVLGLMQGNNNTANREEILKLRPDMILLMSTIGDDAIKTADKIQDGIGIPVVVGDYSIKNLSDTYLFLGSILNVSDRAKTLSDYCKNTVDEAKRSASAIPADERLNVYYAQGGQGLSSAPKGSEHSEVIDLVGGENVVKLQAGSDGRVKLGMEQILLYNPDVIITSSDSGKSSKGNEAAGTPPDIGKDTAWAGVKAVKNDMLFSTPNAPYNWLDMPPSVNRILGVKWLGNLLYPKYFSSDIRKETATFYSLFYGKTLSEQELNSLLEGAVRK